jgi:hypothetical protein
VVKSAQVTLELLPVGKQQREKFFLKILEALPSVTLETTPPQEFARHPVVVSRWEAPEMGR